MISSNLWGICPDRKSDSRRLLPAFNIYFPRPCQFTLVSENNSAAQNNLYRCHSRSLLLYRPNYSCLNNVNGNDSDLRMWSIIGLRFRRTPVEIEEKQQYIHQAYIYLGIFCLLHIGRLKNLSITVLKYLFNDHTALNVVFVLRWEYPAELCCKVTRFTALFGPNRQALAPNP